MSLSQPEATTSEHSPYAALHPEIARRRTFAIISHPDAGKTTLTEKLLLYGGALHMAGTVKARRADRHATSDWLAMEKERGISVTTSVMQFDYHGFRVNLLDTPGHEDFSEDTYRTLVAADCAIMLVDNRKGVEERTRQLYAVCRRRRLPIFAFVNKCDRVGRDPLELLGLLEEELGLPVAAAMWPVMENDTLQGVVDRRRNIVHWFQRGTDHGASRVAVETSPLSREDIAKHTSQSVSDRTFDELTLLEEAGNQLDDAKITAGELIPLYFGSALTNFGIEPFLDDFLRLAPVPAPRKVEDGMVHPGDEAFTGFVFKIQANMDPKHRDRIAFVRVCSGHFEAGLQVTLGRTNKMLRLNLPQSFLAQERIHVEDAWAGDVIGVHDRGNLRIGDALFTGKPVVFDDIPRFPPEHFSRISVKDPLRRPHLDTGLRQLAEEGAVQLFRGDPQASVPDIVGAVGQLQFDVLIHRLEHEYGVPAKLVSLGMSHARWISGTPAAIQKATSMRDRMVLYDAKGQIVLLFANQFAMRWAERESDGLVMREFPD
jgi:peptide chain release factor 3